MVTVLHNEIILHSTFVRHNSRVTGWSVVGRLVSCFGFLVWLFCCCFVIKLSFSLDPLLSLCLSFFIRLCEHFLQLLFCFVFVPAGLELLVCLLGGSSDVGICLFYCSLQVVYYGF